MGERNENRLNKSSSGKAATSCRDWFWTLQQGQKKANKPKTKPRGHLPELANQQPELVNQVPTHVIAAR